MSNEELIMKIDEIKDILIGLQMKNGEIPNKELGKSIYELKKIIDELLEI
ncbi:MAG: hypothetical protein IJW82_02060 [Clostridia bacterium]|nr:hypothetical protein [Clostridia bacterium]